jgi:tetratricopeptide (TPR) repeat protein
LSGLAIEGAVFVTLGPLDDEGARDLLDRMLGTARTRAEPEHVRELARLCGRLPLALCTSAARLAVRPWPIERMVRELSEERRRLAALALDEDLSVRAVFDASYAALPADAARMYRLLGLHPGHDFDVSVAAAAAGTNEHEGARILDLLVGANLIDEDENGRFRFHDLLRLHARSAAESTESRATLDATRHRIIDHYLQHAAAADRRLIPGRRRLGSCFQTTTRTSVFTGDADALAWLEAELPNIVAAQRLAQSIRHYRKAWEFCEALWALFVYRKHYRVWLDTHEIGLAAARADGDPLAEARVLEQLGSAHLNLRRFQTAAEYAADAVRLERDNAHPAGEAVALEIRGVAELALGRPEVAIDAFSRSLALNESVGIRRGTAIMSRRLGDALHAAGRTGESLERLSRAKEYFSADGDRYNLSRTLGSLGRVLLDVGRLDEAEETLHAALELSEMIGAAHQAAEVRVSLADLAARRHRPDEERRHLSAARAVYESHGAPEAAAVTARLERLPPPDGP